MPDIFVSFERTRFDVWFERFTLNIHCGIVVIEFSLPRGLRPTQAPRNQRSGSASDAGE